MPYFPGGGGVGYRAPTTQFWRPQGSTQSYHQPARGTRGRFGQSLSDILGIVSDVAGTVSDDTSSPSYYSAPAAPAAAAAPALSSTTLLLGAAVIGGVIYFATKK